MVEIAEQISLATGKTVRYISISRAERKQALLAAGVPSSLVDALDVQARERLKGAEAMVHPETHTTLGIFPTTFAEFARRNAAVFRGELMPSLTPLHAKTRRVFEPFSEEASSEEERGRQHGKSRFHNVLL